MTYCYLCPKYSEDVNNIDSCQGCYRMVCSECDPIHYVSKEDDYYCMHCSDNVQLVESLENKVKDLSHIIKRYVLSDMMKGDLFDKNVVDIIISYH